jgi:hypothetical protein
MTNTNIVVAWKVSMSIEWLGLAALIGGIVVLVIYLIVRKRKKPN